MELGTEAAEMATITGSEQTAVFAAATEWLREHQRSLWLFGVDFDYDHSTVTGSRRHAPTSCG